MVLSFFIAYSKSVPFRAQERQFSAGMLYGFVQADQGPSSGGTVKASIPAMRVRECPTPSIDKLSNR